MATREQWNQARAFWEANPRLTFVDVGRSLGVSKQAARHHAIKEGWQKLVPLPEVNQKAHMAADQATEALAEPSAEAAADQSTAVQPSAEYDGSASEALAVTLRSGVLDRHRTEWAALELERQKALAKLKTAHEENTKDAWWIAKIASDTVLCHARTLETKQRGERSAWGLDILIDVKKMSDEELEAIVSGKRL